MADVLVVAYLSLWALTSVGLIASSRWLKSPSRPAPHPVAVSLLAGAVWPLLLLGAAQLGVLVAATEALSRSEPDSPSDEADEDELCGLVADCQIIAPSGTWGSMQSEDTVDA